MFRLRRYAKNPILLPDPDHEWESQAVFNGCPIQKGGNIHLLYRGFSGSVSSIGHAVSKNGVNFTNRHQLIKPELEWERFGCEDPRVTYINNKYFIFYTALSEYPPTPHGIKIGLAISQDMNSIDKKYLVTPFNSKAMALFPERINGKLMAILTVNTDLPPAKIALACFKDKKQIWSKEYWSKWHNKLDKHVLPLLRTSQDHLEVGAPPIKTPYGWLIIYSYIKNYLSCPRVFSIEAVLLNFQNPFKIISRTLDPILVPEEKYELEGIVPNIVFPSGALIKNKKIHIYYGAADTTCCVASGSLKKLIKDMPIRKKPNFIKVRHSTRLERFAGNPILVSRPELEWESKAVFNSAAIYLDNKVHLLYRAMSRNNVSVIGYANSQDGIHIDERLSYPIYIPRQSFEMQMRPGNSGCEDPRITLTEDKLYMLYTAVNGINPPRVALTSIKTDEFLRQRWNWQEPILISPPKEMDKNACILSRKIRNKYAILHRLGQSIYIDFVDDLNFKNSKWLEKKQILMGPRINNWDNRKIGITGPPIETKNGWLLIYHGVSDPGGIYKLGVALLDLYNPGKVIHRSNFPILEPRMQYEIQGPTHNVVFSCGSVVIKDTLYVYYGGGDKVIGVAIKKIKNLINSISF